MTSQDIVRQLQLQPHPEGGYYRETYRSAITISTGNSNQRSLSTAIYFLLEDDQVSVFHRIQSDELWFFHRGTALEIVFIAEEKIQKIVLGNDLAAGETPQAVIPANTWFASRVKGSRGFALVSCTVAPGFDFMDFEIAKREDLMKKWPHLQQEIESYTKT